MLRSSSEEEEEEEEEKEEEEPVEICLNLDPKHIASKARKRHGTMYSDSSTESSRKVNVVPPTEPNKDSDPTMEPNIGHRNRYEATQTTCVVWLSQPNPEVRFPNNSGVPACINFPAANENEGLAAPAPAPSPSQITTVTATTNSTEAGKNWPHMGRLVTLPILVVFLQAIDECECTSELAASNKDNPKGNKWTRLYDHCYGGVIDVADNETPRGLLGGKLGVLPSSSKLKLKVGKIWDYVAKQMAQEKHKVPKTVCEICKRQMMEYEDTKKREKDMAQKQKQKDDELHEKMNAYQKGVGAVPPGAKGIEGGGRRQHSTNLNIEEPATNQYANSSTSASDSASTPAQNAGGRSGRSGSARSSSSLSTSTDLHAQSFSSLNRFTDRFERICDRHFDDRNSDLEKKRRRLVETKKNHMETVSFLSGLSRPNQATQRAYEAALNAMMKTNEEIVKLDAEMGQENPRTTDH